MAERARLRFESDRPRGQAVGNAAGSLLKMSPAPSLECQFAGLRCPNPFWLASSPVTNSAEMLCRAFEEGWGGAVYKSLGIEEKPGHPIVNVTPRLASLSAGRNRLMGMENIELITDRPLEENLRDIGQIKREFPNRPLFVSIMALHRRADWQALAMMSEEAGADGLELNFSCPHGSMEGHRAGASIGQHPDISREVTAWVRDVSPLPLMVKLPAETLDIRELARAVAAGGANAVSAINTIPCIIGVDIEALVPLPTVQGRSTPGGYSGPAIKPVALKKVADLASDESVNLAVSGVGGISNWRDAVEFFLLGASTVQICTGVMHYGYRLVNQLRDGVAAWMQRHGYAVIEDFRGLALRPLGAPTQLDRTWQTIAVINPDLCIGDGLCYVACQDGGHQAIRINERRIAEVDEQRCKGCGLCGQVCPVAGCIEMKPTQGGCV